MPLTDIPLSPTIDYRIIRYDCLPIKIIIYLNIAYKGLDVNRVRLILNDSKGAPLADKRKTLNDYSKY